MCYCRHLASIPTETRIAFLQHPRERNVAIGTARMASLCLPNSELHVGVHWQGSTALAKALSDPSRPAALLYPGEGAIDIVKSPPPGPITLIVVDGTWWQTKKVVRENPELAALPRYSFVPPAPSEYRIRREPNEAYVSTIEALVHVLGAIEGDPERFTALLEPFRAMVDSQIDHEQRLRAPRVRRTRNKGRRRQLTPSMFRDRADDLVCVVAEANAWPYGSELRGEDDPGELVHWVACRPSTGETFEAIIAPRTPLAPNTPRHVELSEELLRAGGTLESFFESWGAFLRDTDVVCSWGHHPTKLMLACGGALAKERVDLRPIARVIANRRVGTIEEFHATLDAPPSSMTMRGRAGIRLVMGTDVVKHWIGLAREGLLPVI